MAALRSTLLAGLLVLVEAFGQTPAPGPGAAPTPAAPKGYHRVKLGEHTFTLPQGLSIERVAGAPEVDRPVLGSFDDRGRLYVIDSSGNNARPAEQIQAPTHRVVRLESSKKDGRFDKSVVFADKLPYSQGVLWYKGSVYVGAPPQILKLTDANEDGVADQRDIWHDGKTLTGCGNDLHGPWLGPDGLFYWTKGAWQQQDYTLKNGSKFSSRASHVFRSKPDRSEVEVVMTGGMDNPVGLAFLPNGEVFCSNTFLLHPAGGLRDGIIHCYYGAVYGKEHLPVLERPRTQEKLTEPMTHLGPAAPAGMTAYRSAEFGPEYRGNLFCSQFNMAKVSRHILKEKGATFETIDSDFVSSDNRDFHPTDVIEETDGSLLIIDTGGWYRMCCPSSITEKKDILGAIYRVKKIGAHANAVPPTAVKVPSEFSLKSKSLHERRRAAEQLGRSRDAKAVPDLLKALADAEDPALFSAIVMALIEIGDAEQLAAAMKSPDSRVIQAALVGLEQVEKSRLLELEVAPLLSAKDPSLRKAAWWVASRHPNWGEIAATALKTALEAKLSPGEQSELQARLVSFASHPQVQTLLAQVASQDNGGTPSAQLALRSMADSKLKALPPSWLGVLTPILLKENANLGFAVLRTIPPSAQQYAEMRSAIAKLHERGFGSWPANSQVQFLGCAPAGSLELDEKQFELVRSSLTGNTLAAALDALGKAKLSAPQLQQLSKEINRLGPIERLRLLALFSQSQSADVGKSLVQSLIAPTGRGYWRRDQVEPVLKAYLADVQADAQKLYAQLDESLKEQHAKLEAIVKEAKPGDVRRGQQVFQSARAACVSCHKIAYVGGQIGPDLTRIGAIRSERELLEAVIFPSASFVRSYEPVVVALLDGRSFNGTVKSETAEEVVLTLNASETVRLERKNIDFLKPGTVSIMPAGLDQQLTRQELVDLVAFLKSLR
jgi:putative membrane-bound dehydrogenase-like protein